MDPYTVLGVPPGASPEDLTAAYRRLAKRWHPDRAGERGRADAARRMAEINEAYALLLAGEELPGVTLTPEGDLRPSAAAPPRRTRGHWLPPATRRALGPELIAALDEDEPVRQVTRAATWASPETLLAVTDRRLVWLLEDAVLNRVRSLAFSAVASAEQGRGRLRRAATLTLRTIHGRRLRFTELPPPVAESIAEAITANERPARTSMSPG